MAQLTRAMTSKLFSLLFALLQLQVSTISISPQLMGNGRFNTCFIMEYGAENCQKKSGRSCWDPMEIHKSLMVGDGIALICLGRTHHPSVRKIIVESDVRLCRGCSCFTIEDSPNLKCDETLKNTSYNKTEMSCRNQDNLQNIKMKGDVSRVCIVSRWGTHVREVKMKLHSRIDTIDEIWTGDFTESIEDDDEDYDYNS